MQNKPLLIKWKKPLIITCTWKEESRRIFEKVCTASNLSKVKTLAKRETLSREKLIVKASNNP